MNSADGDSDGTKAGTGTGEATTVTLSRAATQALAQARSPAVNTSTSASSSSAADSTAALKQQEAKLVAQIKATQNDKSLDSQARTVKVAQLNAQKRQIDAQLNRP